MRTRQRLLDELRRDREENTRKWEANQAAINAMLQHDSSIGALGARWGLYSEQSFRNALKGLLEQSFGLKVSNVTDYDNAGEVFGHPDLVELDVIVQAGMLILREIKSSISKGLPLHFEKIRQIPIGIS